MTTTNYRLRLANATWIDVNSRYTLDNLPDLIGDDVAVIHSSLFNLFNCIPGQRARIFQPEYGSMWLNFIHEPINDVTAAKMQMFMLDSIARWEPRIELDFRSTSIVANLDIPGYEVRIGFDMPTLATPQLIQFNVTA